jgi:hypothetical protein
LLSYFHCIPNQQKKQSDAAFHYKDRKNDDSKMSPETDHAVSKKLLPFILSISLPLRLVELQVNEHAQTFFFHFRTLSFIIPHFA